MQFWQKIEFGNEKVGVGWKTVSPSPFISVIFTGQSLFTFQVFIDNCLIKKNIIGKP